LLNAGAYIKSGASVTFGTLDLILHSVKKACINQIEIVFDKKEANQSATTSPWGWCAQVPQEMRGDT